MAATASGPPTVFPTVLYADARAAVRTLTEAFGFAPAAVHETADGQIAHAELSLGNGAVMIGPKGTGSAYDRAMAEGGPVGGLARRAALGPPHPPAAPPPGGRFLVAPPPHL
ncbi:VOC family protein, partial [Streptomyces albidoflavus]|uniref:VOC family protein n=1 Tax=Streptomyces albidoflavus TaxID=1886 RepID=UPI004057945F